MSKNVNTYLILKGRSSLYSVLAVLSFSLCSISTQAQTNLDTLYARWQDESLNDSTRVWLYVNYIWEGYMFSQPDSAYILAEELFDYAENNQYPIAKARGVLLQGLTYDLKGNKPEALHYLERSLRISEEIGDDFGVGGALINIGLIYDQQGKSAKALSYYQRSLKLCEAGNDKYGIAGALMSIGGVYINQDKLSTALNYFERSLKLCDEIDDKHGLASSLSSIGSILNREGKTSEALVYYNRSLTISEEIGDDQSVSSTLLSIGTILANQGEYKKAFKNFERSLAISEKSGGIDASIDALQSIGAYHLNRGELDAAITACLQSLQLSQETGAIPLQKNAFNCLYEAYKAKGNSREALDYLELRLGAEDSLNAKETGEKLQQMEFAKEVLADSIATAEKERLVQEAHEEEVRQNAKARNALAAGGLLVLILAVAIYSRLRYTRKAKAILQVEKDRSEGLLLNILPAEIAEELKEKGKAAARNYDLVSILFTDFKGFTAASEKLSAQDLVSEINICFKAFDGIMSKYNIEKIKTIGDAYMAAGGLPVQTADSVKNTVMAALEMQAFIAKRKAENNAVNKPAFEMRVGIHTGPVVAGIVGVKKFQYDIWGDTVNTASRMESAGEVGKVNISQATYELLKDDADFAFESRGKIEAKGKGEMEMWFVHLKNQ